MPALPVPTDVELEELARTLETPEIPSKLRCGICDLLAFDTMRLPCCSTNICDKCYANELGEECIICCHKPLDKTLCEPNKPMRITIKALLKRKFNDRVKKNQEASRALSGSTIKQTVEEVATVVEGVPKTSAPAPKEEVNGVTASNEDKETDMSREPLVTQSQTNEVSKEGIADHSSPVDEAASPAESDVEIITELAVDNDATDPDDQLTSATYSNFSQANQMGTMNGANNMDFTNGANGMFPMDFASMMAAASSMMPMAGFQNMMGMGMMPMMSQMFGNFDSSNMGMNGMNMDGMEGFQGQNQYGGGNGSWMSNNQANFNGNYGASSGYSMSAHQNNYNQMNEQAYANHDFSRGYGRQGFQNRRGRRGYYNGSFGRGGYQGNNQHGYSNQNQSYHAQDNRAGHSDAGPGEKSNALDNSHNEAFAAGSAPGDGNDSHQEAGPKSTEIPDVPSESMPVANKNVSLQDADYMKPSQDTHISNSSELAETGTAQLKESRAEKDELHHIQAFVSDESQSQPFAANPNIVNNNVSRDTNSGSSAPGSLPIAPPTEPRGTGVIGAPTGPRALREGLPNTGRSGLRYGQPSKLVVPSPTISEFKQPFSAVSDARHDPGSRERSISPERHVQTRHRDSRSPSPAEDQEKYHEQDGYDSRRHRESRGEYEEEHSSRSTAYKHDSHEERDNSRRSKHRSHHYRDKEIDTESRERHSHKRSRREHDEAEGDRHHRSSKRSRRHHDEDEEVTSRKHHRDRSRTPERRSSERDKHSRRKDHHGDHHRRKRSYDDDEPTPTSAHGFTYPEESSEPARTRRKASHRAMEEDGYHENPYPAHERAMPRRTTTASSKDTSSKPSTPMTSTFPPTQGSRRNSHTSEDPQRHSLAKSTAKGPFAALHSQDPPRPSKDLSQVNGHNSSTRNHNDTNKASDNFSRPEKDPHTLEREARDRERLQREMQRRAFMDAGNTNASRQRKPGNPSARRIAYKFEDEGGLDARRVEREREAGRW